MQGREIVSCEPGGWTMEAGEGEYHRGMRLGVPDRPRATRAAAVVGALVGLVALAACSTDKHDVGPRVPTGVVPEPPHDAVGSGDLARRDGHLPEALSFYE